MTKPFSTHDDARLARSEGELSDNDLEQVVGGLSRTWHFDDRSFVAPAVPAVSVTPLSMSAVDEAGLLVRRVAV